MRQRESEGGETLQFQVLNKYILSGCVANTVSKKGGWRLGDKIGVQIDELDISRV